MKVTCTSLQSQYIVADVPSTGYAALTWYFERPLLKCTFSKPNAMGGSRGLCTPLPAESALFVEECNFSMFVPLLLETPKKTLDHCTKPKIFSRKIFFATRKDESYSQMPGKCILALPAPLPCVPFFRETETRINFSSYCKKPSRLSILVKVTVICSPIFRDCYIEWSHDGTLTNQMSVQFYFPLKFGSGSL
jgi:hypothetical protein